MKKHIFILCCLLFVFISSFLLHSFGEEFITQTASKEEFLYGRIISNNANLLKMSVKFEDPSSIYFLLEESYFVKILNKVQDDFYYVEYKDIKGYVKAENIAIVNEQIQNPYLDNITFNIAKDCFLYNEPKNNEKNQILKLIKDQTITYYGKIFADQIQSNSGDVWYYSSVETENGKIFGYIHSSYTYNLSPISPCKEISTEHSKANNINEILNLNIKTQSVIVVIISLPILFLIFTLIKGFKRV